MIYHHHDHLGGTHIETDSTGTAVEYTLYTPFGATLLDTKTGTYENDHKYTNKELDTDTGLYYYGARYYNATMGVFIAQDPLFIGLGMQDTNAVQALIRDPHRLDSYTYSRNNPINLYDPDGNSWLGWAGNAVNTGYNFITLGAGNRAAEMGRSGVTIGGVAHVVGGVAFGTVSVSLAAIDIGAAAGGLAIDAGVMSGRAQTIQAGASRATSLRGELGSAAGKTINGTATIPKNWSATPTRGRGGYLYTNPENPAENYRLMPGRDGSKYTPTPYFRHQVGENYLDANGHPSANQAETHFKINDIQ